MTAPLSAFDEIQQLRGAVKRYGWGRDEARQERDEAQAALGESRAERDRLRADLFVAGRELDEITAERDQARKELADVRADRDDLAQQVARLLGILPKVDEFLAHPETGAVRHRPEPS